MGTACRPWRPTPGAAGSPTRSSWENAFQDLGSALIYLPSHVKDFAVPELRGYLDKYVRGSGGAAAEERVKTLKMPWDAVGTEFGGRHELYERARRGLRAI